MICSTFIDGDLSISVLWKRFVLIALVSVYNIFIFFQQNQHIILQNGILLN